MSFFGDAVEDLKQGVGWKSPKHRRAWNAYQARGTGGDVYDTGYGQQLSRKQFRRLPQKTRHTVLTQKRQGSALGS